MGVLPTFSRERVERIAKAVWGRYPDGQGPSYGIVEAIVGDAFELAPLMADVQAEKAAAYDRIAAAYKIGNGRENIDRVVHGASCAVEVRDEAQRTRNEAIEIASRVPGLTAELDRLHWENELLRGDPKANRQALDEVERLVAEGERLRTRLAQEPR